jgi:hypothetical protein
MSEQAEFPEVLLRMFTFQARRPDPASLVIAQAEAAIQAGFECPALYMLVGLVPRLTDREELERHLEDVLKELGLPRPSARDLLLCEARQQAERLFSGDLTPVDFLSRLYDLALEDEELPREQGVGLERTAWLILDDRLEVQGSGWETESLADIERDIRTAAEGLLAPRGLRS